MDPCTDAIGLDPCNDVDHCIGVHPWEGVNLEDAARAEVVDVQEEAEKEAGEALAEGRGGGGGGGGEGEGGGPAGWLAGWPA